MKKTIKRLNYFFLVLFYFLALAVLPPGVCGQEPEPTPQNGNDIESLRLQLHEQKAQIEKLRLNLKQQFELLEKQQRLLDNLQQKMESANATSAADSSREKTLETELKSSVPDALRTAPTADARIKPEKSETVENGFGKIKFNGLLQGWFAAGDGGFNDTFRIRRAELKFSGEITRKAKWTVMIDPSRVLSLNNTTIGINGTTVVRDISVNQASRILSDAFVTLSYLKPVTVNVGQFKIPVSFEGLQSSAALDTVERALFLSDRARGGALGDVRDIGIMAFGTVDRQFDYQIGVFDGSGENQNDADKNDQKVVAGRFVVRPSVIKGLQIGASGVWGNGQRINRPRRDRFGGELQFERKKFKFRTEFMAGIDGAIHRRGFYAHTGYRFTPKLEGVFRFDTFDPDATGETNAADATERDFITGFNYYIRQNKLKLQFNYLRKNFKRNTVPSRNLILVNLQTSW